MTRYAMAIDTKHCTGCQTCVVACQMHNALQPGVAWLRMDALEWGRWPDGGRCVLPRVCMHCDEPPCVDVCPTAASHKRPDGIVAIDHTLCIGCGVCVAACPYGARSINRTGGWFFDAPCPAPYEADNDLVGTAEKCTFCEARLERGLEPACVAACPTEVRAFGDLDDPDDPLHAFIAQTGAEPVAQTALYCSLPDRAPQGLDLAAEMSARRKDSGVADTAQKTAHADGMSRPANPTVVAVAVVAGAGAAAGLALAAKRSRGAGGRNVGDASDER